MTISQLKQLLEQASSEDLQQQILELYHYHGMGPYFESAAEALAHSES